MLTYLPEDRISVLEAMKHPFLIDLWDENDGESGLENPQSIFDTQFET
jgi:serine/threonine protein kinase